MGNRFALAVSIAAFSSSSSARAQLAPRDEAALKRCHHTKDVACEMAAFRSIARNTGAAATDHLTAEVNQHERAKDPAAVFALSALLVELYPSKPQGYWALAQAYKARGDYRECEQWFQTAINRNIYVPVMTIAKQNCRTVISR